MSLYPEILQEEHTYWECFLCITDQHLALCGRNCTLILPGEYTIAKEHIVSVLAAPRLGLLVASSILRLSQDLPWLEKKYIDVTIALTMCKHLKEELQGSIDISHLLRAVIPLGEKRFQYGIPTFFPVRLGYTLQKPRTDSASIGNSQSISCT